jgi:hypothetical protein
MKITANQRFRDGAVTYEEGEEYEVPDLDGARFVGHGWTTSHDYVLPGATPSTSTVGVQPNGVRHAATSKVV